MEELRVLVVGGSVAGLSCALSLLHCHRKSGASAALEVVVLEKARYLTAAGAGLGLDPPACATLIGWGLPLRENSLPLSCEENRIIHGIPKQAQVVAKDLHFDYRAAHWSDLHRMLYDALPQGTVRWGHEVISFEEAADGEHVKVHFQRGGTSAVEVIDGNLLIAADGSMSRMRQRLIGHEERRYRGYCAWRGVLDPSTQEGSEVKAALLRQYPDLGHCLYFDIADKTHAVLYELTQSRLNWVWFVNQPEPDLKGSSVTSKADEEAIRKMHIEAEHVWPPELSWLMKVTADPFINAIFDSEPLQKLVWGHVVLVGEAAHPTSPHGARSTNMSIMDAAVLGQSISKWGSQVDKALREYEALRLPITTKQVLFSRHMGRVKQGLSPSQLPEAADFLWDGLLLKNMHSRSLPQWLAQFGNGGPLQSG